MVTADVGDAASVTVMFTAEPTVLLTRLPLTATVEVETFIPDAKTVLVEATSTSRRRILFEMSSLNLNSFMGSFPFSSGMSGAGCIAAFFWAA